MPNIALTNDELTMIANALGKEVASAKRAQTSSKTPQIAEVYKTHEGVLKELEGKIMKAANSK